MSDPDLKSEMPMVRIPGGEGRGHRALRRVGDQGLVRGAEALRVKGGAARKS